VQGVVKAYDPATGLGVVMIAPERADIDLGPGSLEGSIFRDLRQGQRIVFETIPQGQRLVARKVRIGSDGH
jgi:cold shock CspA family protein